jgi:hypothetical protein
MVAIGAVLNRGNRARSTNRNTLQPTLECFWPLPTAIDDNQQVGLICLAQIGKDSTMRKTRSIVTAIALLASVAAGEKSDTRKEVTKDQLKNFTYDYEDATGGKAKLVNGKFDDKPFVAGSESHLSISLGEVAIAREPSNLDPGAAAILYSDTGGSGAFRTLVVLTNDAGGIRQVGSESLGDRVKIQSLLIKQRVVTVEFLTQGPQDPMSDPTVKTVRRFELTDGKLAEIR